MSMISELVRELRMADNPVGGYYRTLYARAADTIEELSAKLATSNMERSTAYYSDGWIPCSERLPEDSNTYEVTVYFDGLLFATNSYYSTLDLKWHTYGGYVTAWRERLPEPYKGVE